MDELDVSAGCCCELFQVPEVDGDDLVPILGQDYDGGVDHVGRP